LSLVNVAFSTLLVDLELFISTSVVIVVIFIVLLVQTPRCTTWAVLLFINVLCYRLSIPQLRLASPQPKLQFGRDSHEDEELYHALSDSTETCTILPSFRNVPVGTVNTVKTRTRVGVSLGFASTHEGGPHHDDVFDLIAICRTIMLAELDGAGAFLEVEVCEAHQLVLVWKAAN
jgi:hypothetical protein